MLHSLPRTLCELSKVKQTFGNETCLMSNQQHHHQPLLPPEATTILRDVFGFSKFRSYQQQIIARVLHGKSTLAILPTGAGKSLTYQLPAQLLPQATVVISPLIALMKDQLDRLPPALQQRATVINSTLSGHEMRERLRAIAAGTYKLVYIAPERLRQRSFSVRAASLRSSTACHR